MIVVSFDVLAKRAKTLGERLAEPEGIRLWNMLHAQYMGRIGVFYDGDYDRETLENWMKVNGIKAATYDNAPSHMTLDEKVEHLHRYMSAAGRVGDWFVSNDPEMVSKTLAKGIPSMLFIVPDSNMGLTLKTEPRGWDEVVQEVNRQALIKATKGWNDPIEVEL